MPKYRLKDENLFTTASGCLSSFVGLVAAIAVALVLLTVLIIVLTRLVGC